MPEKFCDQCGKQVRANAKYCPSCSSSIITDQNSVITTTTTTTMPTFQQFLAQKGKERHHKGSQKRRRNDGREVAETFISVAVLCCDRSEYKVERGSTLPIKVNTDWGPGEVFNTGYDKVTRYNPGFNASKSRTILVYKSGTKVEWIPGTTIPFTVKGYKEDLGVPYSRVVLYLLETNYQSDSSDDDIFGVPVFSGRERMNIVPVQPWSSTPVSLSSTRQSTNTIPSASSAVTSSSSSSTRQSTNTIPSASSAVTSTGRNICVDCGRSYFGNDCLVCEQDRDFAISQAIDRSAPRSTAQQIDHDYASPARQDMADELESTEDRHISNNTINNAVGNTDDDSQEVVLVKTLKLHRMNLRAEFQEFFTDSDIDNFEINVVMIDPRGEEELGRGVGVTREAFCHYFRDFSISHMVGRQDKVPVIRHDMSANGWYAVAKMIKYCLNNICYLPLNISIVFFTSVLFGDGHISEDMLLTSFKNYVSVEEKETITEMLTDFKEEDVPDLLDLLSSYDCRRTPTSDSLKEILLEIAHQELVQKPRYITNCFQEILCPHGKSSVKIKTLQALKDLYFARLPSSKKVISSIKTAEQLKPEEQDMLNHLNRYLKSLNRSDIEKFLMFVTGGDVVPDRITLQFSEQIPRAPRSRTCINTLFLNTNYNCFNELAEEFNNILNCPSRHLQILYDLMK